jgi:hypothetical protein
MLGRHLLRPLPRALDTKAAIRGASLGRQHTNTIYTSTHSNDQIMANRGYDVVVDVDAEVCQPQLLPTSQ